MNDHERKLVDQTLTAVSQQQWATERAVERLANLAWDMRDYLPIEMKMRLEFVLSHLPRLRKVRLTDDREVAFMDNRGYFGPSRWILECEWPEVPFCPADPFKYDEGLRKLCELLSGVGEEKQ